MAYLDSYIHYNNLSFYRFDILFGKCGDEYWQFHTDFAAMGCPYIATYIGRNSFPSPPQTRKAVHYIIKCGDNVLYIGHHIFFQGL